MSRSRVPGVSTPIVRIALASPEETSRVEWRVVLLGPPGRLRAGIAAAGVLPEAPTADAKDRDPGPRPAPPHAIQATHHRREDAR